DRTCPPDRAGIRSRSSTPRGKTVGPEGDLARGPDHEFALDVARCRALPRWLEPHQPADRGARELLHDLARAALRGFQRDSDLGGDPQPAPLHARAEAGAVLSPDPRHPAP